MSRNRLGQETSPYLLQHKDNPVHWRPWGPEALEQARRENKPVLLSVGYSACHWCHVMAHESFEDPRIAGLMNALFVNIKVDREERPDLDSLYQSALGLLGEHGGWPLTMFLTPSGEPFWGGTYFPPVARYGRPAFPAILEAIALAWAEEGVKIKRNVTRIRHVLIRMASPPVGVGLDMKRLDEAAHAALGIVDPVLGGTIGAPKFPQTPLFRLLWRAYARSGDRLYRDAVTVTLDRMAQGGIYDHVGGGFSRYATDERWLVPHFEKMLYDNALVVEFMTEVWRGTRSRLYAERVEETISWVLGQLAVTTNGTDFGLAAAFDADSEGHEGRYYVWSEEELDAVLGPNAAAFKAAYDVRPGGNWEGQTILNRSHAPALGSDSHESRLAAARALLRETRRRRAPPERDDKVLADWNGLMITALARAGATFDRPDWIDAARSVFSFVTTELAVSGAVGPRLHHSWCSGHARHGAVLGDYAEMARAAVALFEVTGEPEFLNAATDWVAIADRHYWDPDNGGYFLSADDATDLLARTKSAADQSTPSGNGTMLEVLARLPLLTGKAQYRERALALVRVFSPEDTERLINGPSLLNAFEVLERGLQVVIVGARSHPATEALRRAVFEVVPSHAVIAHLEPDATPPPDHPTHGKGLVAGQPAVHLCHGQACALPLSDPDAVRDQLSRR